MALRVTRNQYKDPRGRHGLNVSPSSKQAGGVVAGVRTPDFFVMYHCAGAIGVITHTPAHSLDVSKTVATKNVYSLSQLALIAHYTWDTSVIAFCGEAINLMRVKAPFLSSQYPGS